MNQQRARRIGMGMKPRGEDEKLPTTEGHEVWTSDGAEEPSSVTVEGGDLAGVVTEGSAAEGEGESMVALNDGFEPVPAVPQEAFDALAAAMKASETQSGAEAVQNLDPEIDRLAGKMLPEMMEGLEPVGFQVFTKNGTPLTGIISQEELKQFIQPAMIVVDKLDLREFANMAMFPGAKISYESHRPPEFVRTFIQPALGELPTGEYRHTVRIAESYVEGAKQQAEADNMNLEDWLTLQLNTYLENWWYANGPK